MPRRPQNKANATKQKKPLDIWISRDLDGDYNIHHEEPKGKDFEISGNFINEVYSFCGQQFEEITGLKLEPGGFAKLTLKLGPEYEFEGLGKPVECPECHARFMTGFCDVLCDCDITP